MKELDRRFLAFYRDNGRAPELLEKIALCETLEELEELAEGARWLWGHKLKELVGHPGEIIRQALANQRAKIGKSLARRSRK